MARSIARDHDAKRGQILATAARVFAETGYDRTSMSQLAEACGISKANIYHYYPGKEALLFDILESHLSTLRDRMAAIQGRGLSAEAHLHAVILEVLMAYRGADDQHRVQIDAMAALPADRQAVLRSYQRDMVAQLAAVLRRAAPTPLADDKRRLHAATMSVFGMLNWFYMWNREEGEAARRDYAALVARMVLRGLPGLAG
ncbi:MAG: TetR/AcrR family transcriptional regulator [Pseudomonadota bacterium]